MRFIKLILVLAVMILGAAFTLMNADNVVVNYYFGSRELPLSVVIVGVLCVGVLLGVFGNMGRILGLKRENAELRKQARLASQEVKNLRALPLKDR